MHDVGVARRERRLAVGQVELPQPQEARVEAQAAHGALLAQEGLAPVAQRLRIVGAEGQLVDDAQARLLCMMAEALLSLEGATCLSLGVQTPLAQLPTAAAAHRADVVALSFSGQLSNRVVLEGLAALRELLPAQVEIWAGGSSRALRLPGGPAGVRCLDGLEAIAPELARWRKLLESPL